MKAYNEYIIDEKYDGLVLRDYMRRVLQLSHRTLVALKKQQGIKLNGKQAYMDMVLKAGDHLEITMSDEASENVMPEAMDLDIIYEDEYFIVLNKPADMPVHPTRRHIMGTLANGLVYHWMDTNPNIRIRPVNRLDKNTSGLIVFAKNAHIQHLLSQKNGTSEFEKNYLALVEGVVEKDSGTIEKPIVRESMASIRRSVCEEGEGDRAITHYQVIDRFSNSTLVSIVLETGRTHQIRVHMSYIGHPLLGDELYGGGIERIGRHALHANRISMIHPIEKTHLQFEAVMPEDMKALIEVLTKKDDK